MQSKLFGMRFNYNRHHEHGEMVDLNGSALDTESGRKSGADALDRAALLRAEREQRLLAETLAEVTLALTSQMSREAVLNEILRQMKRLIPYRAAHIMLVQGNELRAACWQGYQPFNSEEMIANLVQRLADFPFDARVVKTRQPLFIADTHAAPDWVIQAETAWVRSHLVMPICLGEQVLALLRLDSDQPDTFSTEHLKRLQPLANAAAIALERIRLTQLSQQLTTVIEQSAESVILTDAAGKIIYVNPKFEQVTGYEQAEVVGKQFTILLNQEMQESALFREVISTIRSGAVWRGRFVSHKKDGTAYTEEATISPIRNEQGEIINYVSLQRDVTRELKLEEQYRQAQKMEAVGLLAGGLAHDFNNLLTAINGFAELAQLRLAQDDPVRGLVGKILHSGKRAADLIRQVLIFSRKQMIEPKVLDLNELVANLTNMLSRLIEEHIELETTLAADLWPIKADPTQLEQVIVNLVVNGRDAMPNGGQLTIETANVWLTEEYLADHLEVQPGEYVRLTVSDTGIGMSEAVKAHIFEPFFTTKEKGKGTGLGLATVFGIVEQCNGFIWVYSEPGQGTTFKIYLPRSFEPNPVGLEHQSKKNLPFGTETVLVVEDSDPVRSWTVSLLSQQGYKVFEAGNGAEALHLLDQYRDEVQLLLTDMIMPQMGGTALADHLKQLHLNIKVLFTSGYTDRAVVANGWLPPDTAFIQKPFSGLDLALKVRQVLDG